MARWASSNHPRDSKGRFRKKGSSGIALRSRSSPPASTRSKTSGSSGKSGGFKLPGKGRVQVRASLRSATVQYGRTLPIIPGKVNLYLGVLARVEKGNNNPTLLERKVSEATDKLASKIPQKGAAGKLVADLLRKGESSINGVRIARQGGRRRASSIRVTQAKASTQGRKVRQPRQPRQRKYPAGG